MSIEQLPSGSYRITVMVDGHRKRRSMPAGSTRRALKIAEAELRSEAAEAAAASGPRQTKAMSVTQLCEKWLDYRRSELQPATTYGYERSIESRIADSELGALRIAKVTTPDIQNFQDDLAAQGLSRSRIRNVRAVLSGSFQWAVATGLVSVNPTRETIAVKAPRSEVVATDPADWRAAIDKGDSVKMGISSLVFFLGATGARLGEALALSWADLDDGTVIIDKSLHWPPGVEGDDKWRLKPTKTYSTRTVPLQPSLMASLNEWREWKLAGRRASDFENWPADFVWSEDPTDNVPWRNDTASKWIAQTGVLARELRHMTPTQMLAANIPVHTVQTTLGHASPKMTLDVYAEAVPDFQDDAMAVMDLLAQRPPAANQEHAQTPNPKERSQ